MIGIIPFKVTNKLIISGKNNKNAFTGKKKKNLEECHSENKVSSLQQLYSQISLTLN